MGKSTKQKVGCSYPLRKLQPKFKYLSDVPKSHVVLGRKLDYSLSTTAAHVGCPVKREPRRQV